MSGVSASCDRCLASLYRLRWWSVSVIWDVFFLSFYVAILPCIWPLKFQLKEMNSLLKLNLQVLFSPILRYFISIQLFFTSEKTEAPVFQMMPGQRTQWFLWLTAGIFHSLLIRFLSVRLSPRLIIVYLIKILARPKNQVINTA